TGEPRGSVLGDELIVLQNFAAGRQCAPLRRHALEMAAQFDLFDEKFVARLAVFRTFIRMVCLVGSGEMPSRRECWRVKHECAPGLKVIPSSIEQELRCSIFTSPLS